MKKRTRKKAAAQARRKAMRIERLMVTIPGWMAEKDAERLMARLEVWHRHGGAISLPKGVRVIAWDSKGRQIVMGSCEPSAEAYTDELAQRIQELKDGMDELARAVANGYYYMASEVSRKLRELRSSNTGMNTWSICLGAIAVGLMVRMLMR